MQNVSGICSFLCMLTDNVVSTSSQLACTFPPLSSVPTPHTALSTLHPNPDLVTPSPQISAPNPHPPASPSPRGQLSN